MIYQRIELISVGGILIFFLGNFQALDWIHSHPLIVGFNRQQPH